MNRWLLLALFGTYLLVVLAASQDQFQDDEGVYVGYATNLVHGFYTYRDPVRMNLWCGPGYPLLLAPFVALGVPWLAAKVLNALLLLGGVLLFFQTLRILYQIGLPHARPGQSPETYWCVQQIPLAPHWTGWDARIPFVVDRRIQ